MADATGTLNASPGFRGFQDLMQYRVSDILLVSSLYDAFILAEDNELNELLLDEALGLGLLYTPRVTRVSTGAEALDLVANGSFDLVIASTHVADVTAVELARRIKARGLTLPVVLLAVDAGELGQLSHADAAALDAVFLWTGDVRVLLAIVHNLEDRMNVAHDTGVMGVQAIIVIEDNVRFYSSFLPAIYAEVTKHTRSLVPEGVNVSHKLMRIQARPKILLCRTFEEAWDYFERYQEHVLGVISDVEFPRQGRLSREAGVWFARHVRERQPDIPVMLQSSVEANAALAESVGASFLLKGSPLLLNQLRRFMIDHFGFGDFVFRMQGGREVGRASDLRGLEEQLRVVPAESIAYHSERNHFSIWLKARTEFALAHRLRPRKLSDFATVEHLRLDLIQSIQEYRLQRARTLVVDFDRQTFEPQASFTRIGGGSLGGKARGLAFANLLLDQYNLRDSLPGVHIAVPACTVVGTDVFDRFLEENRLRDFAIGCDDDALILSRFLAADFPETAREDLRAFARATSYPLAVRSSSLLEDSQYQPFAGVYETYMLPNSHPDADIRLRHLLDAIKRVYASTFSAAAKTYLRATSHRVEEEKMAVILQRLVGASRAPSASTGGNARFYPDFAGVARSHNYYPAPGMRSDDGIAAATLGLGAAVVEGEVCARFCPRFPRNIVEFSTVTDVLRNSQREFFAIELDPERPSPRGCHSSQLDRFNLDIAEEDGTLDAVGSVYSAENDAIYDGLGRRGVRLVTFAPVLKHDVFPIAKVLDTLLTVSTRATNAPVEMEFAVNLQAATQGQRAEFGLLQLRPLALTGELTDPDVGEVNDALLIARSDSVLGHGQVEVRDVIVVDFHRFERSKSQDVARQVARFNAVLQQQGRSYLLIGVGRWGSSDPYLGIPVAWNQIAGCKVIIEAGFRDFKVTPSQGSHFFQNLTSSNVGYFTVNPEAGQGFVDWDWLAAQAAVSEADAVRHLRFDEAIVVRMNGRTNSGIIGKPGAALPSPATRSFSDLDAQEPRWR
ncbi:MAG: PEP/pyruvate-binding domain-containing protein [Bacteroidales bacterium]